MWLLIVRAVALLAIIFLALMLNNRFQTKKIQSRQSPDEGAKSTIPKEDGE